MVIVWRVNEINITLSHSPKTVFFINYELTNNNTTPVSTNFDLTSSTNRIILVDKTTNNNSMGLFI